MAELADIRKSSVGFEQTLHFLNVKGTGSDAAEAFHVIALRCESDSIDTGVKTEDVPDVTQKTQGTEISSYAPTIKVSGVYLKDDPVCQTIRDIYRKRLTGSACHFDYLEVDQWDGNKAFKSDAMIEVTSFNNEAGSNAQIEYTIHLVSDPVEGTATIDAATGVATFTAGAKA